ncbi:hypothetical protein CEP53_009827 [Fusarium sp. AF-6]|nr:hypothetical protein CEP53_009827 [Fusarium sp. AF-6]
MSDYYYSENYQFYNVDDDGGSGGNPSDASKGLSHDVVYNNSAAYDGAAYTGAAYDGAAYTGAAYDGAAYTGAAYTGATYAGAASKGLSHSVISNNSAAYTGAANTGSNTLVFGDKDNYEKFGTTKVKEYESYWLCENLPEGNEYRIIMKIHADAQVRAAPGRAARRGYPKRHNNREGNRLSVSGRNLLEFPLLPGTFNIWVRGTSPGPVRAIYREDDGVGDRPYDVVYHDPTKPPSLDFSRATLI